MSIMRSINTFQQSQPTGIISIFFIQIVSSLGFSVLYSTLVLYMQDKLGMEASTANSVAGVFIAFNYALHVVGGFWGGRFFSNRMLFCIGMMAQFIGGVLLSVNNTSFLYYGLAVFLTGSGINVTCLNCIITQRFAPDDSRRESAFIWNYSGMNLGFFIGFSLSGFYQLSQDYHSLFLISSLGNIVSIIICFFCWSQLADTQTLYVKMDKTAQKKASIIGTLYVCLLPVFLYVMLQYAAWANKLVLITGVGMFLFCLFLVKKQPSKETKNKLIAFIIFMIVSMVFWMLYQIGPMGLTIFTENNVQRVFGNTIIPPQWFQNIGTVSLIAGGPILAAVLSTLRRRGIHVNLASQFTISLLLIGMAFVLLPMGIAYANPEGLTNPGWIVAYYVLLSIGEMLISPIGYAMIGALVPAHLQSLMMGVLMLYCGVGATLSSYSSNLMIIGQETTLALATNAGYSRVFLILGLFAIACAAVLCVFVPKLRALTENTAQTEPQPNSAEIKLPEPVF